MWMWMCIVNKDQKIYKCLSIQAEERMVDIGVFLNANIMREK
jgi:hypothetical protein